MSESSLGCLIGRRSQTAIYLQFGGLVSIPLGMGALTHMLFSTQAQTIAFEMVCHQNVRASQRCYYRFLQAMQNLSMKDLKPSYRLIRVQHRFRTSCTPCVRADRICQRAGTSWLIANCGTMAPRLRLSRRGNLRGIFRPYLLRSSSLVRVLNGLRWAKSSMFPILHLGERFKVSTNTLLSYHIRLPGLSMVRFRSLCRHPKLKWCRLDHRAKRDKYHPPCFTLPAGLYRRSDRVGGFTRRLGYQSNDSDWTFFW